MEHRNLIGQDTSAQEPVIRVMAEAQEQRVAEACVNEMIDAIKAEGLA